MNHASLSLPISLACSETITNTHHCQLAGPKVNQLAILGPQQTNASPRAKTIKVQLAHPPPTPRVAWHFFLGLSVRHGATFCKSSGRNRRPSISESLAWRLLGGCLARILAPHVQWKDVSAGCTTAGGPHRRPGVVSGMESEDPARRRTSLLPAARLVADPGRHAWAALGGILGGPTT